MSHSYGNGNSSGNNYLNKKRQEDDIPMDSRNHYDRYEKFDKYSSHSRYTNMNYIHSKPPPGNNYYNNGSRYRSNYYNNPKPFHGNSYSNKLPPKRDYKKPYQKYGNPNSNESIRNLSHFDTSPPPIQIKQKPDGDSLKSISSSTIGDSKSNLNGANNGINIKDINKLVSNISSHIPSGRGQSLFQNSQQNKNMDIKLSSSSDLKYKDKSLCKYNRKWRKEDDDNKDEEISIFKFPKPSEKLLNYEHFNRNSIKIEINPLENFEIYPKNFYELYMNHIIRKPNGITISESINKDNLENVLSIKSSYLLAKIPNWRLVTNFVPASSLTEEKFKNIIPLEEDKDSDDRTEEAEPKIVNSRKKEEEKEKPKKSYLVYSEKYNEIIDKALEQFIDKKKQVKKDIFNKNYIIAQYHYDILKIKNKLKQNLYKINFLNIKQENLRNAIDDKINSDGFSAI